MHSLEMPSPKFIANAKSKQLVHCNIKKIFMYKQPEMTRITIVSGSYPDTFAASDNGVTSVVFGLNCLNWPFDKPHR